VDVSEETSECIRCFEWFWSRPLCWHFFAWHKQSATAAALLAPLMEFPPGSNSSRMRRWCHRGIRGCDESPVREKCFSDVAFCVWCVRCGQKNRGKK
jgi:hypothetical protein